MKKVLIVAPALLFLAACGGHVVDKAIIPRGQFTQGGYVVYCKEDKSGKITPQYVSAQDYKISFIGADC